MRNKIRISLLALPLFFLAGCGLNGPLTIALVNGGIQAVIAILSGNGTIAASDADLANQAASAVSTGVIGCTTVLGNASLTKDQQHAQCYWDFQPALALAETALSKISDPKLQATVKALIDSVIGPKGFLTTYFGSVAPPPTPAVASRARDAQKPLDPKVASKLSEIRADAIQKKKELETIRPSNK